MAAGGRNTEISEHQHLRFEGPLDSSPGRDSVDSTTAMHEDPDDAVVLIGEPSNIRTLSGSSENMVEKREKRVSIVEVDHDYGPRLELQQQNGLDDDIDAKQSVGSAESKSSVTSVLRRSIDHHSTVLDPGLVKLQQSIMWIFVVIMAINISSTGISRVLFNEVESDLSVMRTGALRQRTLALVIQSAVELRYLAQVRLIT